MLNLCVFVPLFIWVRDFVKACLLRCFSLCYVWVSLALHPCVAIILFDRHRECPNLTPRPLHSCSKACGRPFQNLLLLCWPTKNLNGTNEKTEMYSPSHCRYSVGNAVSSMHLKWWTRTVPAWTKCVRLSMVVGPSALRPKVICRPWATSS